MASSGFHVLYIDDDKFMLKAASRLLRRLRPEWSVTLIEEPISWLNYVTSHSISPDLVLCDLLMPGIRGDELLVQVRKQFPNSTRALITGDTTVEIDALSNNWTHFILPKPFTEKDFELVLTCAERLRTFPFSSLCREKLAGIESLPVMPSIVKQLERCIKDDQCGCAEFAQIVANEPPLVGQVLKAANSAYFGFETQTSSLNTAVSRLGMSVVSAFALAMLSRHCFKRLNNTEHERIVLHHRDLASVSVTIAKMLGWDSEQQEKLYLVCLLSAIGKLTLREMGYVPEVCKENPLALQHQYQDSDVISAYVLILWGYDLKVAEAVLELGRAKLGEDPTHWGICHIAKFANTFLEAQSEASLDDWHDSLPDKLVMLSKPLLSPVE